jgi:hypothetical protein
MWMKILLAVYLGCAGWEYQDRWGFGQCFDPV